MKLLEDLAITTITLIVFAVQTKGITDGKCGSQGDIVFVLDESGSIGVSNFNSMISFVKDIVKKFVVNKNQIQFGLVTYSNAASTDFQLNTYSNTQSILNALGRVGYSGGGTNTAGALQYLRTSSFSSAYGHRPGVPKLAIVITDGASNNYQETKQQAQLAHSSGIKIMAIGVGGGTNQQELHDIASDPDSKFLFELNSFSALDAIKNQLADIVCKDVILESTVCKTSMKGDIVFLLDNSGSINPIRFGRMVSFVRDIVNHFSVGRNEVQFGVDVYAQTTRVQFKLNQYSTKQGIVQALGRMRYTKGRKTYMGDALFHLRTKSFSTAYGHRKGVPKLAIIITDGFSSQRQRTLSEASLVHASGVTVMAIGVGMDTNKRVLRAIASDPDSNYYFHINSFSGLKTIEKKLSTKTCSQVRKIIRG